MFVVQHGEKHHQPGDPGLTPRGERQAEACAGFLAGRSVAAVHTSPLRRAVETAVPVAEAARVSLVVSADLRERMNWSPECSLDLAEFLREWQRATVDRSYVPAVGESSEQAGARFAGFLTGLMAQHPGRTVAVVSHGGVTSDLLRTLFGDVTVEAVAPGLIGNGVPGGAITELAHSILGWRTVRVASLEHLDPDDWTGHRRA